MKNSNFLTILCFFLLTTSIKSQNCDLTHLTTIENFDIYEHDASGAILFRAKLAIDADGSPRAYGPNNSGLDWTANAGSPGNWWGIVTDANGEPIIQGPDDPFPGMYVSATSLVQSGFPDTSPSRYVDSEHIPFIALPGPLQSLANIAKGDLVYAKNITNGNACFAYFADTGPSAKLGEGSMFFADQMDVNSNPRTGGTNAPIIDYVVFPQSGQGQGTHLSIEQIDDIGQAVLNAAGGLGLIDCLDAQFPSLDCSINNTIALSCDVLYSGASSTNQSVIGTYGCNSWTETGPERVHTIVPTTSGAITANISNFTGDLDVYILGSCDPFDCLGTVSSSSANYLNAVAGQTYYIVVDADDGSGSAYDIIVSCSTTSTNNTLVSEKINLYPNPTAGIVFIQSSSYKISHVEILDARGKLIESFVPTDNTVNIEHYISGVYFFKVIDADMNWAVLKVVKR